MSQFNVECFCGQGEKRSSGEKAACSFTRCRGGRTKLDRKDFQCGPAKRVLMEKIGVEGLKDFRMVLGNHVLLHEHSMPHKYPIINIHICTYISMHECNHIAFSKILHYGFCQATVIMLSEETSMLERLQLIFMELD